MAHAGLLSEMQGQTSRERELRDSFDTLVQKLLNSQIEALLQSSPNDKLVKIQDKYLEELSVELKVFSYSHILIRFLLKK